MAVITGGFACILKPTYEAQVWSKNDMIEKFGRSSASNHFGACAFDGNFIDDCYQYFCKVSSRYHGHVEMFSICDVCKGKFEMNETIITAPKVSSLIAK